MIQIENEYKTIIYEIPKESNYYQNHDFFLLNYFDRPMNNNKTRDDTEEEPTKSTGTNHIYQSVSNKTQIPKEKIWTIPVLLESPKKKNVQKPDLKTDFLTNSGAESNIMNIPT